MLHIGCDVQGTSSSSLLISTMHRFSMLQQLRLPMRHHNEENGLIKGLAKHVEGVLLMQAFSRHNCHGGVKKRVITTGSVELLPNGLNLDEGGVEG